MNLFIGFSALAVNLLVIFQFIVSGQVTNYWSAAWVVMLVVVGGLLAVALFAFSQSNSDIAKYFLPVVAVFYGVLSCAAVLMALLGFGRYGVGFGDFFGLLVLLIFPTVMSASVIGLTLSPEMVAKVISYCFAVTGIIAFGMLAQRYLNGHTYGWGMIGEVVVLIYVWGVFGFFGYALSYPEKKAA